MLRVSSALDLIRLAQAEPSAATTYAPGRGSPLNYYSTLKSQAYQARSKGNQSAAQRAEAKAQAYAEEHPGLEQAWNNYQASRLKPHPAYQPTSEDVPTDESLYPAATETEIADQSAQQSPANDMGQQLMPWAPEVQAAQQQEALQGLGDQSQGIAGNTPEDIEALENLYHETWNYWASNVLPALQQDSQQAKALNNLFHQMRPQWKSLREGIKSNPELLNTIDPSHIQSANKALSDAQFAMQQLKESDQMIDQRISYFQSHLQRAFNSINQLVGAGVAKSAPTEAPAAAQQVPAGGAAPQATPQSSTQGGNGTGAGWGSGVSNWLGNAYQNIKNIPGNLMQGWQSGTQRAQQPRRSSDGRPVITASMGSALEMYHFLHTTGEE